MGEAYFTCKSQPLRPAQVNTNLGTYLGSQMWIALCLRRLTEPQSPCHVRYRTGKRHGIDRDLISSLSASLVLVLAGDTVGQKPVISQIES